MTFFPSAQIRRLKKRSSSAIAQRTAGALAKNLVEARPSLFRLQASIRPASRSGLMASPF